MSEFPIVVTLTPEESEAERRLTYGGFRDRDVRVITLLRARQSAAYEANLLWREAGKP